MENFHGLVSHTKVYDKVWGREYWMANTSLYCGKILEVVGSGRCSIHFHKKKTETFFLLSGHIMMEIEDHMFRMIPGGTVTIPTDTKHRFTGLDESSKIIEVSTEHFDEDSYRVENSYMITDKKEWENIIRISNDCEVLGDNVLTRNKMFNLPT